jgi:hydrogenase maturation protease
LLQEDRLLPDNRLRPVLILGLGNILLQDEGVGVHVVERLQRAFHIPPEVEVLDGGTAGMALYEHIVDRRHLLVIDAVNTGRPPGTVVKLTRDEVPVYWQTQVSPHQLALSDILAALLMAGRDLPEIALIGIEPLSLNTGIGLSAVVMQQMDNLLEMTVDQLCGIGFTLIAKSTPDTQAGGCPFQ